MRIKFIIAALAVLSFVACNNNGDAEDENAIASTTPTINYSLINTYPHDTTSYTEGFLIHNGKMYESTGFTEELPQTRSLFGEVDSATGKINVKAELDKKKYFGEGIVFLHNKVYQLTYRTKIGFVYDAATFKQVASFTFSNAEGWGMTTDSTYLIMSDGTDKLTYLDTTNLEPVKKIYVTDEEGPIVNVNELEYINGFIYANIYTTNYIIKIDPANGKVVGKLDLSYLDNEQRTKFPHSLQLNGIAYDAANDKIYVTGKMWPNIYEIKFSH